MKTAFDVIEFTLKEGVNGYYTLQSERGGVAGQRLLSEKQMMAVQSVLSDANGRLVKFVGTNRPT